MAFVYSCCFWFSLRLGGMIIGFFSLSQAVVGLIIFCMMLKHPQNVKDNISLWTKDIDLIYVNGYIENFQVDPEKYITYFVIGTCCYIVFCVLYIYGAYMCNNTAMAGFIVVELVRLITTTILVITWLLVLKENTMDIGLVIGSSVMCGFVLLGMFYLWTCAANLPVLISEMERDEQDATIQKLQRLLVNNAQRFKPGPLNSIFNDGEDLNTKKLSVISRYQ